MPRLSIEYAKHFKTMVYLEDIYQERFYPNERLAALFERAHYLFNRQRNLFEICEIGVEICNILMNLLDEQRGYEKKPNDKGIRRRIGIAVRRLRQQNGLSQSALARRAGITQPEISLIESGERSNLNTLERVAHALDWELTELMWFAERRRDSETVIKEAREFFRRTLRASK
jgi:DNA-binding XRE family transcriptional regulator